MTTEWINDGEITIPENWDRDPTHIYKHRVAQDELARFRAGQLPTVTAVCTKTWAPTQTGFTQIHIDKPYCPVCFPRRPDPVLAA